MNVKVKLIQAPTKSRRLADASVELMDREGDSLIISDIRILQNKHGQLWVGMLRRPVNHVGGSVRYIPQIEPNRHLLRRIGDEVLSAFEEWKQAESGAGVRG